MLANKFLTIIFSFLLLAMIVRCHNSTESGEIFVSDVEAGNDNESEASGEKTEKKREVEEENNEIQEEVKAELDRAVEGLKESAKEREQEGSLEPCGTVDCNHRGTCIGTKKAFLCACQLGHSGKSCEETVCDSTRDCNGRGLCFGTTNQLTCLCNLGYTGRRCQTPL